jgi:hypothetical protein
VSAAVELRIPRHVWRPLWDEVRRPRAYEPVVFGFGYEATDGRIEGQSLRYFTTLVELLDLLVGDVPEFEPFTRRTQQRLRALRHVWELRTAHLLRAALRNQVVPTENSVWFL